jgi:glycosyltransferase involved in cell wall biosynthesis
MNLSVTEKDRAVNWTASELVSAIIPTRNRPELVVNAVRSALRQSHPRVEVIVVIDGPDPTTEGALAEIHDVRLRIFLLAASVGGAEARNIGVRAARGEWIAFLDDDDEWLSEKIAVQLASVHAIKTPFPVISSKLIVRTSHVDIPRPLRAYNPEQPISEHLFCRQHLDDGPHAMQTSTLFVRRDLMLAVPFRRGLKRHQDWDWLLRASKHPSVSFHVVAEPLTIFRVEDDRPSVSRSLDWEFSLQWAREMRACFTPRAYSFFIATECISRAIKSRAGAAANARLAWEFFTRGLPTFRSIAWLAAFLCFPQSPLMRLRLHLRQRQSSQLATPSAPAHSGAFTQTLNSKSTI